MKFICKSKIKNRIFYLSGGMIIASLLFSSSLQADASVQFHGTLIAASCAAESTRVEFGEVSLDKIPSFKSGLANKRFLTTNTNQQKFSIKLNCTGDVDGVEYKWSGNIADSLYLATDMTGLVIEIADGKSNTILPPGYWFTFDESSLTNKEKVFLAILEKDSSATFEGGEFNATATFAVQIP